MHKGMLIYARTLEAEGGRRKRGCNYKMRLPGRSKPSSPSLNGPTSTKPKKQLKYGKCKYTNRNQNKLYKTINQIEISDVMTVLHQYVYDVLQVFGKFW